MTAHRPIWQEPRQDQRLSHRTILRFQELANELRDDLDFLNHRRLPGDAMPHAFLDQIVQEGDRLDGADALARIGGLDDVGGAGGVGDHPAAGSKALAE